MWFIIVYDVCMGCKKGYHSVNNEVFTTILYQGTDSYSVARQATLTLMLQLLTALPSVCSEKDATKLKQLSRRIVVRFARPLYMPVRHLQRYLKWVLLLCTFQSLATFTKEFKYATDTAYTFFHIGIVANWSVYKHTHIHTCMHAYIYNLLHACNFG